jgi:hypothetical protein
MALGNAAREPGGTGEAQQNLWDGELHFPLPGPPEREKHPALDDVGIEQPAQVVWLATWGKQALMVWH